jgi:Flp pilus assembly protein TadG
MSVRKHPGQRAAERGVTIVESAIILLMFFMLLFGVVEAGRFLNYRQVLTNAAREGARFAVTPLTQTDTMPTKAEISAKVDGFLSAAHITGATTTVKCPTPCDVVGQCTATQCDLPLDAGLSVATTGTVTTKYTKVTVSKPYSVISIPGFFNMLNITLQGESLMRRETSE